MVQIVKYDDCGQLAGAVFTLLYNVCQILTKFFT